MKFQKLFFILLILAFFIMLSLNIAFTNNIVFAEEFDVFTSIEDKDRETIKIFTAEWISEMYNHDGTYVDNIVQVFDYDDTLIGYIIEFKHSDIENGYLVLDKDNPTKVVKFSLRDESEADLFSDRLFNGKSKIKKLYKVGENFVAKVKENSIWKIIGLDNK